MVHENVRTVIIQQLEAKEAYSNKLLATINELAPLTHPQQRLFDNISPIVTSDDSMETASRNIAMKIILDLILLATRKRT
jgi:hypothetical protein